MRGFFSWLVTFAALAVLLTLSGLNLQSVSVDLSPAHAPFALPLFVVILGGAGVGFIWGLLITWIAEGPTRAKMRRLQREVSALEQSLRAAQALTLTGGAPMALDGLLPPSHGGSRVTESSAALPGPVSRPHPWWRRLFV